MLGLLIGKQVARKWNEVEREREREREREIERGWNRDRSMYENRERERTLNGQIKRRNNKI